MQFSVICQWRGHLDSKVILIHANNITISVFQGVPNFGDYLHSSDGNSAWSLGGGWGGRGLPLHAWLAQFKLQTWYVQEMNLVWFLAVHQFPSTKHRAQTDNYSNSRIEFQDLPGSLSLWLAAVTVWILVSRAFCDYCTCEVYCLTWCQTTGWISYVLGIDSN